MSLFGVITQVWKMWFHYLVCRTMLLSVKRQPHLFSVDQRNYVNVKDYLGAYYGLCGEEKHYSVLELFTVWGATLNPGNK